MSFPFLKDILYALTGIEFPFTQYIPTFGLCVALSFILGIYIFSLELKRLQNSKVIQLPCSPSEFAQNLCIVSIFFAMLGAKIFYLLEYPREFLQSPFEMFFSRGGWTIFGGLLFGFTVAIWFVKKRGHPAKVLCDAVTPVLFIGYAVGRMGCHLSGDGDWGIVANLDLKPQWWPEGLWAHPYTNNVIGVQLEAPVYPTPLYEALAGVVLFLFFWFIRRHKFQPGWLFSLGLFFLGFERLLIEQIRVNVRYDFSFIQVTQAEIISVLLMTFSVVGIIRFMRKRKPLPEINSPQPQGSHPPKAKPTSKKSTSKKK